MVPSLLRIGMSDGAYDATWRTTTKARIRSCLGCLGLHYAKLKCIVHHLPSDLGHPPALRVSIGTDLGHLHC